MLHILLIHSHSSFSSLINYSGSILLTMSTGHKFSDNTYPA